jgi:hypothetical protein
VIDLSYESAPRAAHKGIPFYLIRDNATPHYTASETLFRSALNKLQRGRHLYLPSRQKKLID